MGPTGIYGSVTLAAVPTWILSQGYVQMIKEIRHSSAGAGVDKRGHMASNKGGLFKLEMMDSGPELQKGVHPIASPGPGEPSEAHVEAVIK